LEAADELQFFGDEIGRDDADAEDVGLVDRLAGAGLLGIAIKAEAIEDIRGEFETALGDVVGQGDAVGEGG
jgi:hypothetical protein